MKANTNETMPNRTEVRFLAIVVISMGLFCPSGQSCADPNLPLSQVQYVDTEMGIEESIQLIVPDALDLNGDEWKFVCDQYDEYLFFERNQHRFLNDLQIERFIKSLRLRSERERLFKTLHKQKENENSFFLAAKRLNLTRCKGKRCTVKFIDSQDNDKLKAMEDLLNLATDMNARYLEMLIGYIRDVYSLSEDIFAITVELMVQHKKGRKQYVITNMQVKVHSKGLEVPPPKAPIIH